MYCAKCGTKVPPESKFCPECGESTTDVDITPEEKKETKRKPGSVFFKIAGWIGCLLVIYFIISIGYFLTKTQKPLVYTHPTIGFSFGYPRFLNLETPTFQGKDKCPSSPCYIVLRDPVHQNAIVNWIFVMPISFTGSTKDKFEADFDVDVQKGYASQTTINNIRVLKYMNDPKNDAIQSLYKIMSSTGLDIDLPQEDFVYSFISDDSAMLIGFRKPPAGAPAGYKYYLDIQSWKNPAVSK